MPLSDFFADISTDSDSGNSSIQDAPESKEVCDLKATIARSQKTKKARDAALVSRVKKKLEGSDNVGIKHTGAAKEIQKMCLTERLHHNFAISRAYDHSTGDPKKKNLHNRARCAWSLLCFLGTVLENILLVKNTQRNRIKHLINTIVPDDTNTRLKGPARHDRSVIFTIMNQVQNCIVTYDSKFQDDDVCNWHCLALPCPTRILHTPDALSIHAAYTSYLIAGSRGIGTSLQNIGLPPDTSSLKDATWVVQVMCGDALEANSAAFQIERRILASKRRNGACLNKLAVRLKCCNHQLGLIRRPIVLGVERYWSTLVRLSHLFESAAFRRRLAAGIISLLGSPGIFERASIGETPCFPDVQ